MVQISEEIRTEIDGPMLRYGLQCRHNKELMALPRKRVDLPDRARLEERYEEFLGPSLAVHNLESSG